MTLGNAASARVRLIVWCKACGHRAEPDPAEIAQRFGAEIVVLDWRDRLVCSHCGSRDVDMIVTGTGRRD
jgi:DNA-directed RNA polymerase subunit RPC12/RpoP